MADVQPARVLASMPASTPASDQGLCGWRCHTKMRATNAIWCSTQPSTWFQAPSPCVYCDSGHARTRFSAPGTPCCTKRFQQCWRLTSTRLPSRQRVEFRGEWGLNILQLESHRTQLARGRLGRPGSRPETFGRHVALRHCNRSVARAATTTAVHRVWSFHGRTASRAHCNAWPLTLSPPRCVRHPVHMYLARSGS
ncbi:hypothetical protein BS50DRAFT_254087 [Corynespora cassiicola Philippines]|uniref:Uncharacterized protein n=1 Tax=Corynespora cassiicola Philippines TaxID=1448308 RepID=A0A2T2P4G1_CORCC|nr:hypothetical protein BS50DRAFT_254087 [Corynespora cassiicola Philippines]